MIAPFASFHSFCYISTSSNAFNYRRTFFFSILESIIWSQHIAVAFIIEVIYIKISGTNVQISLQEYLNIYHL